MKFRSETGAVLVLVLIFLLAISWLGIELCAQTFLAFELAKKFEWQYQQASEVEEKLRQEEKKIVQNMPASDQAEFVPNHLEFGCNEGMFFSKVVIVPYQTWVGVPTP